MTNRHRHSARLKPIGIPKPNRFIVWGVLIASAVLLLGLIFWGLSYTFNTLGAICNTRCRIQDTDLDVVVVTPGKMVQAEVILLHFGLTNGANLAEIKFERLREKLLTRVPNIQDIKIERRQPNRVTITVAEREPLARVIGAHTSAPRGLMTDSEGTLFRFARTTASYPVVRVSDNTRLMPGERLVGRNAAALRLVEMVTKPEFLALNVQEVNAAPRDYLLLTLGNYSRAKIAWEHMDEATTSAQESLHRQLKRLMQAMAADLVAPTTTWIVTDYGTPGRVYASDPNR